MQLGPRAYATTSYKGGERFEKTRTVGNLATKAFVMTINQFTNQERNINERIPWYEEV